MVGLLVLASFFIQCHVMVNGRSTHQPKLEGDKDVLPPTIPVHQKNEEKFNHLYLNCTECFGHGIYASADPRCKYGCNRVMTYPVEEHSGENNLLQGFTVSTEFDSTNTPTMSPNVFPAELAVQTEDTQVNQKADFGKMSVYLSHSNLMEASKQKETEPKQKSSFLVELQGWKGMLGLGILCVVSISLLVYAVYKRRTKTAPQNLTAVGWAKSTETIVTEI